jgi:hypothetical protein
LITLSIFDRKSIQEEKGKTYEDHPVTESRSILTGVSPIDQGDGNFIFRFRPK